MKKAVEVLVYLLSIYTLFVFVQQVLIGELKVKLTPPFSLGRVDGIFLAVGGFVLGIVLYLLKGRFNKIFATVMIIENVISIYIGIKYLI